MPEWFCDWHFYPRSKSEVLQIIIDAGIQEKHVKMESLESGIIFSLYIDKK